MKFQASLILEAPVHEYVRIFGPVEVRGDVVVTRACNSIDHLKMLCGTFQGRMERAGIPFTGAVIQERGVEPPDDTEAYQVVGPLKVRMNYSRRPPYTPAMNEMDPPNQKIYEPRTAAAPLEHPSTIIVPPNEFYPEGLTEQQIVDYYDSIKTLLVKQYQELGVEGLVVMKTDEQPIVRRNSFDIRAMDLASIESIDALNHGRTVEFHFALGETTKVVWVDLDPGEEFPFEDTKFIALDLQDAMSEVLGHGNPTLKGTRTEVRFSGKSGFHILHYLENPINADEARLAMKNFVGGYIHRVKMYREDDRLTEKATKDPGQIRLDYSTLHVKGGLRASYSLAFPTGLICLPIATNQVMMFKKEDATINAMLGKTLPVQTSEISDLAVLAKIKHMDDVYRMFSDWMTSRKLPEDLGELQWLQDTVFSDPENTASNIAIPLRVYLKDPQVTVRDPNTGEDVRVSKITKAFVQNMIAEMLGETLQASRRVLVKAFDDRLEEYKKKREFDQTPEPAGATTETTEPIFVIQQHDAHKAKLHYDFRLAHEGVLKSWAIPKLMDLVSGEKDLVLAVETEPHPIEYAKFEGSAVTAQSSDSNSWPCVHALKGLESLSEVFGSIPSGYGAGEVKIWDEGAYVTEVQDDDHWKFKLSGNRLSGEFTLIRTAGNRWILRRNKNAG